MVSTISSTIRGVHLAPPLAQFNPLLLSGSVLALGFSTLVLELLIIGTATVATVVGQLDIAFFRGRERCMRKGTCVLWGER